MVRTSDDHTSAPARRPATRWWTHSGHRRPGPLELAALALLIGAFVAAAWQPLSVAAALGHDESVYALKGRAWLTGLPDTGFGHHRPPGLPVVAAAVQLVGGGETAMRAAVLACGLALLLAAYAGARWLAGPLAGLLAAGGLATSPTVLRHSTQLLNDVPSAAALLIGAFALLAGLARVPADHRWLLLAAPFMAAAFYLRYGVAPLVAMVVVVAVALRWSAVRAAWHSARLSAVAPAALLAILLLPHLVNATREFGAPWGRLAFASGFAQPDAPWQALSVYVGVVPVASIGRAATVLAATGLVALLVCGVARALGTAFPAAEAVVALGIPAVVMFAYLSWGYRADPRFLLPVLTLLVVLGAAGIGAVVRRLPQPAGAFVTVTLLVVTGLGFTGGWVAAERAWAERHDEGWSRVALLGGRISDDAGGPPCVAVTAYVPQITWASGCATVPFDQTDPASFDAAAHEGPAYLVVFEHGKQPQPRAEALDPWLERTTGSPAVTLPGGGHALGAGMALRFLE